MQRTLATIAVCLCLVMDVPGQLPVHVPSRWQFVLGNGSIERLTAAHLTPNGCADVVFVADGGLWIAVAPHIHNALLPLPAGQVNDLATLTFAGRDSVWYVGPSGLHSLAWAAAGGLQITPIETVDWAGASRIRVGDLDGDGEPDAIGVAADSSVMLVHYSSTGQTVRKPVTGPVKEFVAVNWDGVGGDEVVVVTTDAVVYDGTLTTSLTDIELAGSGEIRLERIVTPNRESLGGVVQNEVAGESWVLGFTVDPVSGQASASPLRPGSIRCCVSHDVNSDGATDLVVGYGGKPGFDLYINGSQLVPGLPAFRAVPGLATELDVEDDFVDHRSWPCCADLDGDGDGELCYGTIEGDLVVVEADVPGLVPRPDVTWAQYDFPSLPNNDAIAITLGIEGLEEVADDAELLMWRIAEDESGFMWLSPAASHVIPVNLPLWTFDYATTFSSLQSESWYCVIRYMVHGQSQPASRFILARADTSGYVWAAGTAHNLAGAAVPVAMELKWRPEAM